MPNKVWEKIAGAISLVILLALPARAQDRWQWPEKPSNLQVLPKDWPGRAARKLCGEIYRGLLPSSEKWLDRNGLNENGRLPAAGAELARRFGD